MDKSNKSFSKSIYLTLLAIGLYAVVFGLATFTLFSARGEANNKLIAGTLDIDMSLVEFKGTESTAGYPVPFQTVSRDDQNTHVDLEEEDKSLFVVSNAVPGITQSAVIEIVNNGTVAFDYDFSIIDLKYGENETASMALAEQIKVVVANEEVTVEFYLSEYAEKGASIELGSMFEKGEVDEFTVSLEFLNLPEDQSESQGGYVEFDIQVKAMQVTRG